MASAIDDTCGSSVGSMPRTMAPLIDGGRLSMASVSRNGAAPIEPGRALQADAIRACQSAIGAPAGRSSVACAERLSSRPRSSDLEAVHHRQHRNQGGHAHGDAEQRHPGDEGDEKAMLAGQRIAQAHEYGKGLKHARRLNHLQADLATYGNTIRVLIESSIGPWRRCYSFGGSRVTHRISVTYEVRHEVSNPAARRSARERPRREPRPLPSTTALPSKSPMSPHRPAA